MGGSNKFSSLTAWLIKWACWIYAAFMSLLAVAFVISGFRTSGEESFAWFGLSAITCIQGSAIGMLPISKKE